MVATKTLPLVLGSLLGIMLAILVVVLFLFYKKRKESMEFNIPLEKMTRGLKSSLKRKSTSSKNSKSSNDSIHIKPQGVSELLFLLDFSEVKTKVEVLLCKTVLR